jgi:putative aminopeptidase FrvX
MASVPSPVGIDAAAQQRNLDLLLRVGAIPTAAGKEDRVLQWLRAWLADRPTLAHRTDASGNVHVELADKRGLAPGRPVYFTAHLDHPAFTVERIVAPTVVELAFRGGVMDDYFPGARVVVYDADDNTARGRITGPADAFPGPFKHYLCDLETSLSTLRVGDIAVWDVGPSRITDGFAYVPACDDLSAVAAMVGAMDALIARKEAGDEKLVDARLLFTRAEEVGFIGAIGAVREGTMQRDARVIALENSRAFPESPVGAGPIVRVGDRLSVFSPTLTDAIAKRAEQLAGAPATPRASEKLATGPSWKWQRKLMAGGACEASVYYAAGYEATCVCLPLGNYHNMADLAAVQAGTNTSPPTIASEFIGVTDYHALIDLLVGCATGLPEGESAVQQMTTRLWNERSFVLER